MAKHAHRSLEKAISVPTKQNKKATCAKFCCSFASRISFFVFSSDKKVLARTFLLQKRQRSSSSNLFDPTEPKLTNCCCTKLFFLLQTYLWPKKKEINCSSAFILMDNQAQIRRPKLDSTGFHFKFYPVYNVCQVIESCICMC